jgi:hypothetical protein
MVQLFVPRIDDVDVLRPCDAIRQDGVDPSSSGSAHPDTEVMARRVPRPPASSLPKSRQALFPSLSLAAARLRRHRSASQLSAPATPATPLPFEYPTHAALRRPQSCPTREHPTGSRHRRTGLAKLLLLLLLLPDLLRRMAGLDPLVGAPVRRQGGRPASGAPLQRQRRRQAAAALNDDDGPPPSRPVSTMGRSSPTTHATCTASLSRLCSSGAGGRPATMAHPYGDGK